VQQVFTFFLHSGVIRQKNAVKIPEFLRVLFGNASGVVRKKHLFSEAFPKKLGSFSEEITRGG